MRGGAAAVDWGINAAEQIGAGFSSNYENAAQPVLGLENVTQIKAGFKFGLALLGDCTLRSWGSNTKGQLGNGNQQTEEHPVAVLGLSNVKEIAVANAHAMALLYNGTVWTWGASEFGERGNREKGWERTARATEAWAVPRDVPIQVPGLSGVEQIAAGGMRDYALLASGEVMAWGEDQAGELGVGEAGEELCYGETHGITPVRCSTVPRPVVVSGLGNLTGVERIGAGEETAYAIRGHGEEALAWGANGRGQLGDGETQPSPFPVPVQLEPPSPVVEVVGGSLHTLARLADGRLYAWGADESGQLGFEAGEGPTETCGVKRCETIPTPVYALDHVVSVAAGEGISFALKEEQGATKVIYSFGATGHYELLGLGDVELISTSTPTPIAGLGSVGALSASTTSADAMLEASSGQTPLLALTPGAAALKVAWMVHASAYKLRDRPVGTKEFGKTLEGSCSGECTAALTGLRPEPYEVSLKTPEGREGTEKTRHIVGVPLPAEGAPVNLSAPTVAGAPATETGKLRLGQTLTASPGTWSNSPSEFAYRWLRCEGLGEDGVSEELGTECETITSGEAGTPVTSRTYEVQAQDVGRTLVARVEAKNAQGWSAAVSAAELILAAGEETEPPAPTGITAPTVTGRAVQGQTLTAHHGSWENEPTSLEDKWFRCKGVTTEGVGATCSAITFKNPHTNQNEPVVGETYVTGPEDVGLWIGVQERAQNVGGWNVAPSNALQVAASTPPQNVAPPTITGTAVEGQTLTEHEGEWTNAPGKPTWQWLRCDEAGGNCLATSGATKQTYEIASADVGHRIAVIERVSNGAGIGEARSTTTIVVPPPPPSAPSAETIPTTTGTPQQGQVLTGRPASWAGEPDSFSYQWKRCSSFGSLCKPISGAFAASYTLTGEDVGHTIVFKEVATNPAGSGIASSVHTAVITGVAPVASSPPTISGPAVQGQLLTEHHGSWSNEPDEFRLQWVRCASGGGCQQIAGATGQTYIPASADVGKKLAVEESAVNGTGAGAATTSAQTATVLPAAPASITLPTVSGTAKVGQTLTESPGSWSNAPTAFAYQWLRCEETSCVAIEGATQATYTITSADLHHALVARETASNAGGWGAAVSEPVGVNVVPPPHVSGVSPNGGPIAGGTLVTITGSGFTNTHAVDFGSTEAREYNVISAQEITAVSPAGSAGAVDITVTTPHGTSPTSSADEFSYGAPPSVSHIEPATGPEGGGTVVTIFGSNLGEAESVSFGNQRSTSFGVASSSLIRATAPAGSGTVDVTVTTRHGTTSAGGTDKFTYFISGAPPVIEGLSVHKGAAAGGTMLTISGTNLSGVTAVRFGSVEATSFVVLDGSSIDVESPPGSSGTVDVTATNSFATSATTSKDHFKYERPTITSVSPAAGLKAGGTVVTVIGSGFAPGEGLSTFKFKKALATAVECASTTECVMLTPPSAVTGTVDIRAVTNGKTSAKAPADLYAYD